MTKVFLGGSRNISRLNQAVKKRTDNILSNGYLILLGDANGADKAIQQYLSEKNYRNVIVFCMGNICRNNIDNWKTRCIYSDRKNKDFNYYSTKDLIISNEADYGFMLWDGKSKGTLNNILSLCEYNKKVLVYFSPTKSFHTLKNLDNLSDFLKHCDQESLMKFDKALRLNKRIQSRQNQFDFA